MGKGEKGYAVKSNEKALEDSDNSDVSVIQSY